MKETHKDIRYEKVDKITLIGLTTALTENMPYEAQHVPYGEIFSRKELNRLQFEKELLEKGKVKKPEAGNTRIKYNLRKQAIGLKEVRK